MSDDLSAGLGVGGTAFGSFEIAAAEAAHATGDFETALHWYETALAQNPDHAEAHVGRCKVLRQAGHPRESLTHLVKFLAKHPKHLGGRLELALTLQQVGRGDEARSIYSLLVRETGAPAEAWHGLALVLLAEGKESPAEAALRRALALAPNMIEIRQQLAELTARRQDLAAAADMFQDILAIATDSAEAQAGLAQVLIGLNRMDEARDRIERALAIQPDNATAHLARARLLLLEGNLPGAWDDMDWRWRGSPGKRPNPPGEHWTGDSETNGRTVLLYAGNGLDDTLQMLRYTQVLSDKGARVVLGLPSLLAPLGSGVKGAWRTIVSGQPVPKGLRVDYSAAISDMPRLLGTTLTSIPPTPYIEAPAEKRPSVIAPPGAMLKVGVSWGAARAAWGVPFPSVMTLLGLPGAAFFGLQLGTRARDASVLAHPTLIHDLSSTIADYGDLAGRIAEMDLVITVDGPVAHLAGAMGKPVWLMLPYAADWRWMTHREDSPWYPSARLFRQDRPGDWTGVLTHVMTALEERVAEIKYERQTLARAHVGDKAKIRALLSTHLQSGDLLIDVGAGDGGFSMDAADHPAGGIKILAIEARPSEAGILRDTVDLTGLSDQVEVLCAALGSKRAPAVVANRPYGGKIVFSLPDWVRTAETSTTFDALISERSDLMADRLLVRIGAKGQEDEIVAGMEGTLRTGTVALLVFEHRAGGQAATLLQAQGYRLFRFPSDIATGAVVPFADEPGTVLALAPSVDPAPVYGDANDPTSPAAMSRASAESARLASWGVDELNAGRPNAAGELFSKALAQDPFNVDANANLGGLLRRIGRADAAIACWRRALACGGGTAIRANLANVLRESGHLASAESAFLSVLADEPDNPRYLYAFGLLLRDQGRAKEALATFERAETLAPGTLRPGDHAVALLKSGNLARGMAEMVNRRPVELTEHSAPLWDGSRLDARTILVRDEGDAIDTVMLARFLPMVARQGGLVTVECVPELARLLANVSGVEKVVPRGGDLPVTDCAIRLPDVPRLIGTTSRTTPIRDVPYLHLPHDLPVFRFPDDGRLRVGVAWSGRPTDRNLPLHALLRLASDPAVNLISLQRPPALGALLDGGGRSFFEEMGSQFHDLADSASVIAGLDLVIASDTVEAHIAGALGRPVWVLLPLGNDWRWVDGREDSVWYPTMRVFRQSQDSTWDRSMQRVSEALSAMVAGKLGRSR
jgi:FkbM family methyltransferase